MAGFLHAIWDRCGVPTDVLDVGKDHSGLRKATCLERMFYLIPSSTLFFVNDKDLTRLAKKIEIVRNMQEGKKKYEEGKKLARAKVYVKSLVKQLGSTDPQVQSIGKQLLFTKLSDYSFKDLSISDFLTHGEHLMNELAEACKTGESTRIKRCIKRLKELDDKHHCELCQNPLFADIGDYTFSKFLHKIDEYQQFGGAWFPGRVFYVYASKLPPEILDWYCKELQKLPDALKAIDNPSVIDRLDIRYGRLLDILLPTKPETLNRIPQNVREIINSLVEQEGLKLLNELASQHIEISDDYMEKLKSLLNTLRSQFFPNLHPKVFHDLITQNAPELLKKNSSFVELIGHDLETSFNSYDCLKDLHRYEHYKQIVKDAGLALPEVDPGQIQIFRKKCDDCISKNIRETFLKFKCCTFEEIRMAIILHKEMHGIFLGSSSYSIRAVLETIVQAIAEPQKEGSPPPLLTADLSTKSSEALINMLPLRWEYEKTQLIKEFLSSS